MSPVAHDEALIASSTALLRSLSFAKVKFLRYFTLDVGGNVRCKVIPIAFLRKCPSRLLEGVAIVKVSIGGMPSYADLILPESGLTAAGTLMLRPDLETLRVLPYSPDSAIVLGSLHEDDATCNVCCRSFLRSTVQDFMEKHNLIVTVGIELEFILFDVATGKPVDESNFANVTLLDQQQEFVGAVYGALTEQEISVELLHSESASGQMEIVLEYLDDPVKMADHAVLARQTIKAVAGQHGMKAVFLPKVFEQQAGNGCHVHLSLRDGVTRNNVFAPESANKADKSSVDSIMSRTGQSFVEGILRNLPALMAITMPTTSSFRRVGQGCWTGSQAVWAEDDKEAPLRVIASASPRISSRVEFKLCDSTANIYLALASIVLAGEDGIAKHLDLRAPLDSHGCSLPKTIMEGLNLLETSEMFQSKLPEELRVCHLAIRRAEAIRGGDQSLQDELREVLLCG
jgi:glutamine synthetase